MIVFDYSISGGSFVTQCSFTKILSLFDVRPDLVTSASGGNIPAFLGAIASWKYDKIFRDIEELNSSVISKKRYSSDLLNYFVCLFNHSSIYARGEGVYPLLSRNMSKIVETEIWTNCTVKSTHKSQLFCNLNKENSKIYNSLNSSAIFANGDPSFISSYCEASCTIPCLLEDVRINGIDYIDSGISYASCLSNIITHTNKSLWNNVKVFLFSPFGMDFEIYRKKNKNIKILSNAIESINSLIFSSYVKDRQIIVNKLFKNPISVDIQMTSMNKESMSEYLKREYSILIELISEKTQAINITKFDENDIRMAMENVTTSNSIFRITFESTSV